MSVKLYRRITIDESNMEQRITRGNGERLSIGFECIAMGDVPALLDLIQDLFAEWTFAVDEPEDD